MEKIESGNLKEFCGEKIFDAEKGLYEGVYLKNVYPGFNLSSYADLINIISINKIRFYKLYLEIKRHV